MKKRLRWRLIDYTGMHLGLLVGLNAFHVIEPGAGGEGGGGAGGAAGAEGGANPDLIPRAEAAAAFKARDAAKNAQRRSEALASLMAQKLGIDPAELELVDTGDQQNPFDLKGEGIERVTKTLSAAEQARVEQQKKAGKWEDRERELNDLWTKKTQKLSSEAEGKVKNATDQASKRVNALENWINETAGRSEIRAALAAENAVHDGQGNYDELVELVERRVKREIAIDEQTGKAKVAFVPLAEDGTPLLDSKGQPGTVKQLVGDWLSKRPQFRAAKTRGGPGAGGFQPPAGRAQQLANPADRGRAAARMLFTGSATERQGAGGGQMT